MIGNQAKWMTWTGWVITVLIVLMMAVSGTLKLVNPPKLAEQFTGTFGYPGDVTMYIGIVEISCVILYLIPPTAVLGAVLLTGYLGGAIATHVRIHDNFLVARDHRRLRLARPVPQRLARSWRYCRYGDP